jgi:hypothetical protein
MREVELVLRIRLPRWSRMRWLVTIGAVSLAASAVALALPNGYFTSGATLQAADLNAMLAAINKPDIATTQSGKHYSLAALYCGATASSTNGQITEGYVGAKTLCQSTCGGSPSAHMCNADELTRSAQLGIPPGSGWYTAGVWVPYNSQSFNDCVGWSSNSNANRGATWVPSPPQPGAVTCDTQQPVLCCD